MTFNIGTVVYYATKYGSKKAVDQILKKKTNHCMLVFKDCFNSGKGYLSNGESLYEYDSYYKKQEEGDVKKNIADFYGEDVSLCEPKKVREALEWVMNKTYVSPSKYNQKGFNLKNGVLEVAYSKYGEVSAVLKPISNDVYATYLSEVEYNPEVPSEIARKLINEMFETEAHADIVLKNLASIFDRNGLRKRHGRQLKALFLYGPGSNGKDTLKEWIDLLLGNNGMTSIPLHDFKLADKKSCLLVPLLTSKINWASENNKIALDRCACLKTLVTGDRIEIDVKYQSSVNLSVDVPLVFNFNEEPALSILNQASLSRFCLIKLPYVFCSNPDRSKNQKKVDYKLKNDKDYLIRTILPSFLNLLIEKFISFYEKGIDYSRVDSELLQMAKDSNHLYDFIEEFGFIECALEHGINMSDLYKQYYVPYLIKNGFASQGMSCFIFHDCEFDRFAKNANHLSKMLSKVFYGLKRGKIGGERRVGINVNQVLPD